MSTPQVPRPEQSAVTIEGSIQYDLVSAINGRTYRIFVFTPPLPAPPSGYPVVLVTDANLCFPIAATMARAFAQQGRAAVVVGVGYPSNDLAACLRLRQRDLTPSPPEARPRASGFPTIVPEDYGGALGFYPFLEEELRPSIRPGAELRPPIDGVARVHP